MLVINTPTGLFEYNRLAFGLSSWPFIFKKFMDTTLAEFSLAKAFLDDVIIGEKILKNAITIRV